MNDFYERVKAIAKSEKKLSLQEFILSLGLNHDSYYSLKRSGNLPRADEAVKIAEALGTSTEYLVNGINNNDIQHEFFSLIKKIEKLPVQEQEEIIMLVEYKMEKRVAKVTAGDYTAVQPVAPKYAEEPAQKEPKDSVKILDWEMVMLPFMGKTAAGKPIDISAYTEQGIPFPLRLLKGDAAHYFAVEVRGESMTAADIKTGDHLIIKRAKEPIDGQIMLIRYEDSSTLKRIKIDRKNGTQTVYICWEDGSGKSVAVDSSDYEIQGMLFFNLGK